MTEQGVLIDVAPYAGNDDEDVRYTLDDADAWLREKAGVDEWDLDVAACKESHRAEKYYTLERRENGLQLPWARRTFINPPWSDIEPWIVRAWQLMQAPGRSLAPEVLGFLLPLRTHRPWWQLHIEPHRDKSWGEACLLNGFAIEVRHPPTRFRYGCPGNPRGVGMPEPNFQTVGIVFRRCS